MFKIIKFSVLSGLIILLFAFVYYKSSINKPIAAGEVEAKIFIVEKGEGVNIISQKLEDAGLIKSRTFFRIYAVRSNRQTDLKAGKYLLSQSMSIIEIVDVLTNGNVLNEEKSIKIIEGWNNKDIAEYFNENGLDGNKFLEIVKNVKDEKYSFLNDIPKGYDMEGFLFPDTYRIFINSNEDEVVNKMLDNFNVKLTEKMRTDIKAQGKTVYEIVIMASVIQKEVRGEDDMKLVSGVFWNRIKNNKPLESCATLAYILGVNKKQYTLEDTKIDSAYNTYQNQGLPPGPISNPGIKAIEAAIYPTDSDYFYFLSSFEDGETIFSKTYDEHLRNKAKYLR